MSHNYEKQLRGLRQTETTQLGLGLNGGAGGNRTPVHQALFASDTTIPVVELTQLHRRVD